MAFMAGLMVENMTMGKDDADETAGGQKTGEYPRKKNGHNEDGADMDNRAENGHRAGRERS
jgi:hypothetical protein